jgi:hypothetical protein
MKKITKSFLQSLAHSTFWIIGFFAASKLMGHSEAKFAYGYLTGWWAALYFGYIGNLKIASSVSAFIICFCVGIVAVFLNWYWFYKDLPESVTVQYMFVLIIGGGIFISPILINSVVRLLTERLRRK